MPLVVVASSQAPNPAVALILTYVMEAVTASWMSVSSKSCQPRATLAPPNVSRSASF